ncbi:purine-nucleoside phosphorylase [soil metagenome]|nr:purine-nucleoside phosphorylase [Trueperaceae bacterium]
MIGTPTAEPTAAPATERAHEAAHALRRAGVGSVDIGIVLGSGLGPLAAEIEAAVIVPFADVPGMPPSTAPGHAGRVVAGRLAGRDVVAWQGRLHPYEGYDAATCAFPVRVMHALGARTLLVSSACGGLDPTWQAGDLMLHLDLINASGSWALTGQHDGIGDRFTIMFDPYDATFLDAARAVATDLNTPLREGIYLAIAGPAYATRAELRAYRSWGADAIGMSTVHEVAMARHLGLRVLGLSTVTDMALPESDHHATGDDVLAVAEAAGSRFRTLVKRVLPAL